jgi:hypothetical protein
MYWHVVECCGFVAFWRELRKKTKKWKFAKKNSTKCRVFLSSRDFRSLMIIFSRVAEQATGGCLLCTELNNKLVLARLASWSQEVISV